MFWLRVVQSWWMYGWCGRLVVVVVVVGVVALLLARVGG